MATTQSGYSVIGDYGDPLLVKNPTVPGSSARILGGLRVDPVYTVLMYYAARFNAEVEALEEGDDEWGYSRREIRGGSGWSNHAGGCAIDLNSQQHPQHRRGTFSADQYAVMRQIARDLADAAGGTVLRLGIDWDDSSVDEMHIEIAPGVADTGRVEAAANAIKAGQVPNVPTELLGEGASPAAPAPAPPAPSGDYPLPSGQVFGLVTGPDWMRGGHPSDPESIRGHIRWIQRRLIETGCVIGVDDPDSSWADGVYEEPTAAAVRWFQAARQIEIDGLVGPVTWAEMGK